MSDYTKTTNFTAKDSLASGDADKLIKGSLFDTEFDAIAVAIATKYDTDNLASEAQAKAGTSNAVLMTPQRVTDWAGDNAGMISDIQALTDPAADTLLGWDDSAGAVIGFTLGAGILHSGTALSIDHDAATNFVANEHIDHSAVSILAGNGLTGGGTIEASRTLAVGAGTGIAVAADAVSLSHLGIESLTDPAADRILFWDDSATATAWLSLGTGLSISGTTMSLESGLAAISALSKTDGNIIVGNGTTWVAESGATARTSLGLTIGTNVQAHDAGLDAIAALAVTDGNFIVGNGSTWVAESGATVRTSLGLGTSDSPQFSSVNIGHASDSTLSRLAAGILAVEGLVIYTNSSTTYDSGKIHFSTSDPTSGDGADGDIWFKYS